MPLDTDHYVIVNIWTSNSNKAMPGVNVGHASITTPSSHISLWPEAGGRHNKYKPGLFKEGKVKPKTVSSVYAADYVSTYEQDCLRETISENAEYELCLMGYELCVMIEHTELEENKIYLEFSDGSIQYSVIGLSGQPVRGTIEDGDRGELLTCLTEAFDVDQFQSFLPGILEITARRNHTRANPRDIVILRNKLYLESNADGSVQYTLIGPSKKTISDRIDRETLGEIHPSLLNLLSPLTTITQLAELEPFLPEILKITSERGHSKDVLLRPIFNISELAEGETVFRFDDTDDTQVGVTEIPEFAPAKYSYWAVKLRNANIRVALFSLNLQEIEDTFEQLKEGVTGWAMQGSNMLTRTFCNKTTENCASLVYRCLLAGGIADIIQSRATSQLSSVITPDDLLRRIVAAKENEINHYIGDPNDWKILGVEETPLIEIIEVYNAVGANANVEHDRFPSIVPTIPRCAIQ